MHPIDLEMIPDVIEGIWKVQMGSGWGSVTLQIQDSKVIGTNITETRVSEVHKPATKGLTP
mgnify:FL=1